LKSKLVPLYELGEIISGSTPDTTNLEYWRGNIPWITPADLTEHQGIFFTGDLRKITELGYKSCSTKLIPPGSILFSSRAPIGHCAITTYPLCTNQGFKNLVPNKKLDPIYGYFALKYLTPQIESLGRGATFTEVNKELFENICIPLPPLPEQQRIAAILQKADHLRHLRRYARQLSDGYLQSVFLEMFGDPVTNPKKWRLTQFNKVCDSRLGKMLDEKRQTGMNKHQYLRNFNVHWFYFDLSNMAEMDFDEKDQLEFQLRYGDVLICEGGEVGRTAIWRDEVKGCYFQKALHRVRPYSKLVTSEYIMYLMWWMAKNGGLGDFTSQVTIAHLTGEKLKDLIIPIPPLSKQNEFLNVVNQYILLSNKQFESERQMEYLFQSLLQRAFQGEL